MSEMTSFGEERSFTSRTFDLATIPALACYKLKYKIVEEEIDVIRELITMLLLDIPPICNKNNGYFIIRARHRIIFFEEL